VKKEKMKLRELKIELPKTWQESSRSGDENQFFVRLNHISPLANIDPKAFQDQLFSSASDKITITKIGIPRFGPGPLKDFYNLMKALILNGVAPPGLNLLSLEKLWKGMTETPGFKRSGESDLSVDVSITMHETEEIAKQSFENIGLMQTKGLMCPCWEEFKYRGCLKILP